ncbi:lytic transglycosylase domain-containing protein [Streptomyces wedmorensis]
MGQFGDRLSRAAVRTSMAALAVAALAASHAPETLTAAEGRNTSPAVPSSHATPAVPSSDAAAATDAPRPYHTDLPPLGPPQSGTAGTPGHSGTSTVMPAGLSTNSSGIPATVLAAYKRAEAAVAGDDPRCRLPWQLLAAIGKVESGQARGGRVDADGTTLSPILGPVLNGVGFANIRDTDNGRYDGDTTHDRAVGPMQFIPSTWATSGQDGSGDGRKDPHNVHDAALAAGRYLCAHDRDLSVPADLDRAILSYNHSREYLRTVMSWFTYYKQGAHQVPDYTRVKPVSQKPAATTPAGPGQVDTPPKPAAARSATPAPAPVPPPRKGPKPVSLPAPKPRPVPVPPPAPIPRPAPTDDVSRLEDADTGTLAATASTAFAQGVSVRAVNARGKAVTGVAVRFEILGDTDTRFPGGATGFVTVTGADGTATAPPLRAGEKTGVFTVRATVIGRSLPHLDYTATVTTRQADVLTRLGDEQLTATTGGEFAQQVELKATYRGATAAGVTAVAALAPAADAPSASDDGPYFTDGQGKPVRTLTELKTGADGVLRLPKIFTDTTTGIFLLHVTTAGGATLTLELTVHEAGQHTVPRPVTEPTA